MKKTVSIFWVAVLLISISNFICSAEAIKSKKIDLTDYTQWSFGGNSFTQPKGTLTHGSYDIGSQGVTLNTTGRGGEYWCNISTNVQQVDFSIVRYLNFKIKTAGGKDFWNLKILNKDTGEWYDYAVKQADLGTEAWRGVPGDREGALNIPDNWNAVTNIEINLTGIYFMDVSENITLEELELSSTARALKASNSQDAATSQGQSQATSQGQSQATSQAQTQSKTAGDSTTSAIDVPKFSVDDVVGNDKTESSGKTTGKVFSLMWLLVGLGGGLIIGGTGGYFVTRIFLIKKN